MNKYVLTLFSLLIFGEVLSQITKTQVGLTKYDLQTNSSIQRRIVLDPTTGAVAIAYTGADIPGTDKSFSDRSAGYYYFNGSGSPTPYTSYSGKIGTYRTGWPSISFNSGSKESMVVHRAGNNLSGLVFFSRNTRGSGTWNETIIADTGETWPRMANTGDSIVVITTVTNTSTQFGMNGGLAMKRSYNGGASWIPAGMGKDSIPGINLAVYPNITTTSGSVNSISADEYAVDVKGSKIAILTGAINVTLYVSNDFGNTWSSQTLIAGDNNTSDTLPLDNRSHGDYSVLIDNNNKVHCFWGRRWANNFSGFYIPVGIMYWNENMGSTAPRVLNQTVYEKEVNGELYMPFVTHIKYSPRLYTGHRVGYTGHPSSGIDASGNLYLSFIRTRGLSDTARARRGYCGDNKGMLYSNAYLMKSMDGGATWIGPVNVSNSDSTETNFPCIARNVDNNVHMVYQEDNLVGNCITNDTLYSHLGTVVDNKIIYARIPTTSIVNTTKTPPVMVFADSFSTKLKINSSKGDTLSVYIGCDKFRNTDVPVFSNALQFAKDYLVKVLYDDRDTGTQSMVQIDTPDGMKLNVEGIYRLKAYAKDSDGNTSNNLFDNASGVIGSLDTIVVFIHVTPDRGKPSLNLSGVSQTIYIGGTVNLPSLNPHDDNTCKDTVYLTKNPSASDVDVNTPGIYKLVYEGKDVANNYTQDTFYVYVGKEPTPYITNESVNATTNKINAKGETSDTLTFTSTTYSWYVKKTNSAVKTSVGSNTTNLNNISVPSGVTSFDSLCLEVRNLFNLAPYNKTKKTTCKYLKFGSSISSSNNQVEVTIFPNPNQGNFNIAVSGNKSNKAVVSITALDGRKLAENRVEIKNGLIPMSLNLSSGTYFLSTEIDGAVKLDKIEIK